MGKRAIARRAIAQRVEPAKFDVSLETIRHLPDVDRAAWVRLVASIGFELASARDGDSWWHDCTGTWIRVKARRLGSPSGSKVTLTGETIEKVLQRSAGDVET